MDSWRTLIGKTFTVGSSAYVVTTADMGAHPQVRDVCEVRLTLRKIAVKAVGFHEHLDVCERCREEPFNLCPIGAAAIARDAAKP